MSKNKLILIGGGGHCKSCIDVIEEEGRYEIVGILDEAEKKGELVFGYEIVGTDDDYEKFRHQDCSFLITVGQIKTAEIRRRIFENLKSIEARIATIIAPTAYVSKYAEIKTGTIVMHHAFVNAGVRVEENCILNTACNIEHDVTIGVHSHISTGAFVNGDCHIGNEVFIGSNVTISNHVNVGDNVIVGAGSLVIKNIANNQTVVGVPVKTIK